MGWRVITLAFALLVSSYSVLGGVLPQPGIQSQHNHNHQHHDGQAQGNAAETRSLGAAEGSENAKDTDEDYFDPSADRSYNFEFAGDEYSRRETADNTGNVVGTYTFVDASGASKTVNYKAGAETGFVIEDGQQQQQLQQQQPALAASTNMLQQVPAAGGYASPVMMMVAVPNAAGGYSYMAPSNALPVSLAMPMPIPMPPARLYETPSAPVIATNQYASPVAEPITPAPQPPARLYETPAAPVVATNQYASPAAEPITPAPAPPARLYETPTAPVIATNLYASPAAEPIAPELPKYEEPAVASAKKAAPKEESKINFRQPTINQEDWAPNNDFAFDFKSADGSRKEEALPEGGVKGSYTMQDASGQTIEVRYKATPETGFVIENMDEVLLKSVPAGDPAAMKIMKAHAEAKAKAHAEAQANGQAQSGQSQGVQQACGSPQEEQTHDEALQVYMKQQEEHKQQMEKYMQQVQQYAQNPEQQQPQQQQQYAQQQSTQQQHQSAQQYAQQQPQQQLQQQPQQLAQEQQTSPAQEQNAQGDQAGTGDSSYSFQYNDASAGSRQEHADATGNVRGQYSYTNEEGNTIAVQYTAGPNTGFVVENAQQLEDSVKKATVDGAKAAAAFKTSEDKAKGEATLKSNNGQQAASSASGKQPQGHAPAQATRSEAAPEADSSDNEAAANNAPAARRTVVVKKRKQANANAAADDTNGSADVTASAPTGAGDHSFSFSYAAKDGSARQEQSDAAGERMGSYRYTDEKGETVEVKYRAGRNGFQVINA